MEGKAIIKKFIDGGLTTNLKNVTIFFRNFLKNVKTY